MFKIISNRKFKQLVNAVDELNKQLEKMSKEATLIAIDRTGKRNTFTFFRDGQPYMIQTMGLLSDDTEEWKEKLLK